MSPQDPELAQFLTRYVPVRIVNFKGVDLNLFKFDYDLTFAALLMNPDGRTYARFGTNDWKADAGRMSIPGLKRVMREVLAKHGREPRVASSPTPAPRRTLADVPAFMAMKQAKDACYHCHYANNARFRQLELDGKFVKELLYQHPHPENVGITLEVDANNVVRSVAPGSPADQAGIRPKDMIRRAGSTEVYSTADFQFALNEIPDPGRITLGVDRQGKRMPPVTLSLPKGWRRSDISWRPSQGNVPPTVGLWARTLPAVEKQKRGIAADRMALQVNFFFPGPKWARTRGDLRNGDILLGVDGQELPEMTTRQFHSHFRLNHNVGDTATLMVMRGSQRLDIRVPCLDTRGD